MREFCKLFEVSVLEAHDLLNGAGSGSSLALVIVEPGLFLVIGDGPKAQADLLFGFAQFDDLEIELLADGHGRLFGSPASGIAGYFREMAEALDAFRKLYEGTEAGQAANAAMHRIADLVILKIGFPGVRLELLDPQGKTMGGGIDIQDDGLYNLAFFEHLGGVLDALRPGEIGDVDQAVDALLDFDKCAEVRHVADAAFHYGPDAVAIVNGGPGIRFELLETE